MVGTGVSSIIFSENATIVGLTRMSEYEAARRMGPISERAAVRPRCTSLGADLAARRTASSAGLFRISKVSFVVGNIQNHLDGVGGPDNVTIALVVHGQALRAFHASAANPDLSRHIGQFSKAGLELAACGNTMKSQKLGLEDLLPGFVGADQGGVVRIAELQSQGYLYLRP